MVEYVSCITGMGTNMKEQMKNYRRYVEEGLLKNIPSPFDDITEQSLMGSDSFIDRIKRQFLLSRDVRPRNKNEQPGACSFTKLIFIRRDRGYSGIGLSGKKCGHYQAQIG